MDLRWITAWVDGQGWLDTTADALQPAVKDAFAALGPARRNVKNFLHGTWLGHPLHPVLTDIPLGAWTATLLLDAMADRRGHSGIARAADASLALGLAGAVALIPLTPIPALFAALMIAGSWIFPLVTVFIPHNPLGDSELLQTRLFRGTVLSVIAAEHLYHLEHHLYPQVPHHYWPRLARRLDPHFARLGIEPVKLFF